MASSRGILKDIAGSLGTLAGAGGIINLVGAIGQFVKKADGLNMSAARMGTSVTSLTKTLGPNLGNLAGRNEELANAMEIFEESLDINNKQLVKLSLENRAAGSNNKGLLKVMRQSVLVGNISNKQTDMFAEKIGRLRDTYEMSTDSLVDAMASFASDIELAFYGVGQQFSEAAMQIEGKFGVGAADTIEKFSKQLMNPDLFGRSIQFGISDMVSQLMDPTATADQIEQGLFDVARTLKPQMDLMKASMQSQGLRQDVILQRMSDYFGSKDLVVLTEQVSKLSMERRQTIGQNSTILNKLDKYFVNISKNIRPSEAAKARAKEKGLSEAEVLDKVAAVSAKTKELKAGGMQDTEILNALNQAFGKDELQDLTASINLLQATQETLTKQDPFANLQTAMDKATIELQSLAADVVPFLVENMNAIVTALEIVGSILLTKVVLGGLVTVSRNILMWGNNTGRALLRTAFEMRRSALSMHRSIGVPLTALANVTKYLGFGMRALGVLAGPLGLLLTALPMIVSWITGDDEESTAVDDLAEAEKKRAAEDERKRLAEDRQKAFAEAQRALTYKTNSYLEMQSDSLNKTMQEIIYGNDVSRRLADLLERQLVAAERTANATEKSARGPKQTPLPAGN